MADTTPPSTPTATASTSPSEPSSSSVSGFESWRKSMAMFTGLGLTDAERAERDALREQETLARDWDKCEKWKKSLMETSE